MSNNTEKETMERIKSAVIKQNSFSPIQWSELGIKKFTTPKYIINKLIPFDGITAISGNPGVGKSFISMLISKNLVSGENFLDFFQSYKTGCLYIDEENGEHTLQDRFKRLLTPLDLPLWMTSKKGVKLDKLTTDLIIDFCKEKGIGIVIFDSLVRINPARDENSSIENEKIFSEFRRLNTNNISVVFIHHHRKSYGDGSYQNLSQMMRGSSDILAGVDSHIVVDKLTDNRLLITQSKLRQDKEQEPFEALLESDENENLRFIYQAKVTKADAKRTFQDSITTILDSKRMSKKEILEAYRSEYAAIKRATFYANIQDMIDKGIVSSEKGAKNTDLCWLPN